jgi:hypothetical protein
MANTEDQSSENIGTQADRFAAELPDGRSMSNGSRHHANSASAHAEKTQPLRKKSPLYVIFSGADIYSYNKLAFVLYRLTWGGMMLGFLYRYLRKRHEAWKEQLDREIKEYLEAPEKSEG